MCNSRTALMAAVILIAATRSAPAGPDFIEDCLSDAGSLPGSAKSVTGPGASVMTVRGCLDSVSPFAGPPDLEDMYLIQIDDPIAFHAATMFGDATNEDSTEFNAQLFLFTAPNNDGVPAGRALLANQQGNNMLPPGSAFLGNMSNDGTGVVIDQPGRYYLAISELQNLPVSQFGSLFQFTDPFEVSGPDGKGGGAPIEDWDGNSDGVGGQYTIFLSGVVPVPVRGDTNGDGVVNVNDLNNVILDWGTPGAAHGGDVTGPRPGSPPDGIVDVNDLNEVIVNWT